MTSTAGSKALASGLDTTNAVAVALRAVAAPSARSGSHAHDRSLGAPSDISCRFWHTKHDHPARDRTRHADQTRHTGTQTPFRSHCIRQKHREDTSSLTVEATRCGIMTGA